MVEEQWVDFVSGSYSDHRDPYLFMIYARIKSDELVPKVRATIDEHIRALQADPVAKEDLERIKSHLRYSFALGLDSPGSIMSVIANYLTLTGDPHEVNRIYAQYQKVTPADIQRVARDIFQPRNGTVVTLSYPTEKQAESEPTARGR
jgi:zinc protease